MGSKVAANLDTSGAMVSHTKATSSYKLLAVYVLAVGAVVVAVADVLTYFRFAGGDLLNAFIVATFVLLIGAVLALQVWIASLVFAIGTFRQARLDGNPKAWERAIANLTVCILALPGAPALWVMALVMILDLLNRMAS